MRAGTVAVLAATAVMLCGNMGAVAAEPIPNRTPGLGEIFNGYTVGAITNGTPGTPQEVFGALRYNDPFYQEPPLTGSEKPGTVLKAKKVDVMFSGLKPANLDAYKLMYLSTELDGVTPAISTGILMIPRDGKQAAQRRLISYQAANDSVGWSCHPSTQWTGGDPLDGASWSALGPLALMFGRGYAVVISDIGNDANRHPHGVFAAKYAAHTQLDAARAAVHLNEAGLNPHAPISLFGIAGGGVGAAFSAELAPAYAPDLNVKSAVLEGMVVNQRNFMRMADGGIGSGFAFATLLGLEPKYPEMALDSRLNPAGQTMARVFRNECQDAYFTTPFVPLRALFNSGVSPADEPAFQHVFDDNELGRSSAPKAKVLIASCAADDSPMSLVPAADSRKLAATYRSRGTDVSYQPTDCGLIHMLTNLYGWGTDLFGMQTIDWLDHSFD